jgi:hypothetical protein
MNESIRAEECNWDEDFKDSNSDGGKNQNPDRKKIEWMSFPKPGQYRVRLIGKAVRFLKYYKPFGKGTRVITHKSYKDEDPAWQAGFYPNDTYAIHILDRDNGNAIKILEKGKTLFKCFAQYQQINKTNPAGKEGPDFVITVVWPKGNKNKAQYSATATQQVSALSAEEKEIIKKSFTDIDLATAKKNNSEPLLYRLINIYKTTDLAKIKEMWNNLPESAKIPPKKEEDNDSEQSATTHTPQPKIEEPKIEEPKIEEPKAEVLSENEADEIATDSDDLFGSSGGEDVSPF